MSPYEVFMLQSFATSPQYDIQQIEMPEAQVSSISWRMRNHLEKIRTISKTNYIREVDDKDLLKARYLEKNNHLTLMSALCFDEYPQRFFPKLRITYLEYPNIKSSGEQSIRYTDNKRFEGPIQEMLDSCLSYIKQRLANVTYVEDEIKNKQLSEIPTKALREVLINAIVHRDYSPMGINREIQVRLYPNRLEVENPGGLFGGIRVDSLASHILVSRNAHFATLLEDLGLIENRGDGVPEILAACKAQNLEPPKFLDRISSFIVVFNRNSNQSNSIEEEPKKFFSLFPEGFSKQDVIKYHNMSEGEAKYFLKQLLKENKIYKFGKGRGTKYLCNDKK